jgi:outer membrane protein with beta-barrel domain
VILKNLSVAILALGISAAATSASAQTMQWTDKGYVSINGGVQAGSHNIDTSLTFPLYEETATVTSTQKVKGGGFFDIGGAYRVWGKNLLAGVTFSHTSSDAEVTLKASIPDTVVTDRPRPVETKQAGAKHSENVVHLNAIWMIPVANKLDIGVFAGPSIFSIKQQTIGTPTVTEPVPTVTAPLNEIKKSSAGFNAGVDVQYMLRKKWGVGGIARYTWGSATIAGATKKLTVGGFQIGAGGRVRF